MRGLEFALNDIGLAAFTTLAPAAACAYVALVLLVLFGGLSHSERSRVESWLILPLAIATVGLIASATHLGDPGNALYVFMATGESPLSNEVLTAIVFLGTSCSYWLARIYFENMRAMRVAWLLASLVTGLFFIWGTANAYQFSSVITWNTVYALVNLPLVGLAGCAPLVALVLVCARAASHRRFLFCALAVSLFATIAACASMVLQNEHLATLHNAYGSAADLAPWYPYAIALFGACSLASIAVTGAGFVRYASKVESCGGDHGESLVSLTRAHSPLVHVFRRAVIWCTGAVALAYAGIAGVRFCFYCFHMTAGVV